MAQPPPEESRSTNDGKKKSKRMPSARELDDHANRSRNRNSNSPDVTSAKLDAIHSRLLHLEMKLDSKPSYPQALGIGIASAGVWNAGLHLWNFVRQATSSSHSS
ncbi:hypothetical protein Salat_1519200 [Sesamum alatum]|uniref:Uncharacterized protein n=1 Tax=Sesamum alatum TaxID=300844 RepID=A0AAE2CME2_9LAMI|nr:hypothetical protein Salat_1519200 [Sesamum alatum]